MSEGIYNVKDYSAKGDGITDDTAAIQRAIDAVPVSTAFEAPGGVIYFPRGTYLISRPLRINKSYVTLTGPGNMLVAELRTTSTMPILCIGPTINPIRLGAPLVSGPGNSLLQGKLDQPYYFNLRESQPLDIDGLGAFTAECFFRPDGDIPDIFNLINAGGKRFASEPRTTTFSLGGNNGNIVYASLNVAGTYYQLVTGSVLVPGMVHHLALTYDGAAISLFVNGQQAACQVLINGELQNQPRQTSVPATGPLRQLPAEDVTLGIAINNWPDGDPLFMIWEGALDSVRISKVARYTADFPQPSAKWQIDADTLILLNFEEQYDIFTQAATSTGPGWFPLRNWWRPGDPPQPSLVHVEIRNLCLSGKGTGIFAYMTTNMLVDDVFCLYTRQGIHLFNNCYESSLKNIQIIASRGGLWVNGASGVTEVQNLVAAGGDYPLLSQGSQLSLSVNHAFIYGGTVRIAGLFKADIESSILLTDVNYSDEDLDAQLGTFEGAFAFSACGNVCCVRSGVYTSKSPKPCILIHSDGSLPTSGDLHQIFRHAFYSCVFSTSALAPSFFETQGLAPSSILLIEPSTFTIPPQPPPSSAPAPVPWGNDRSKIQIISGGGFTTKSISATLLSGNNLRGSITISEVSMMGNIVFPIPEPDGQYYVTVSVSGISGSPAPGSTRTYVTNKTATGFTVQLEAPPGAGNSVTVDWLLVR